MRTMKDIFRDAEDGARTPSARRRTSTGGERRVIACARATGTETFDDFTTNFISNEALEASGGAERKSRTDAARRDDALASAIECEFANEDVGKVRVPRRETYERLVEGILRPGRGRTRTRTARRLTRILRECETRSRATSVATNASSSRLTVITTAEAWTPMMRSDAMAAEDARGLASPRSPGWTKKRGVESDWTSLRTAGHIVQSTLQPPSLVAVSIVRVRHPNRLPSQASIDQFFLDLLERSAYDGKCTKDTVGDAHARRSSRARITRKKDLDDDSVDDSDDDSKASVSSVSEDDEDPDEESAVAWSDAHVGAKLLFLHSSALLTRDANCRLRAFETWRDIPDSAMKLATEAMLYKLIVEGAPTEGERSALFATLVDVASLAGERAGADLDAVDDGNGRATPSNASLESTRDACGAENCSVREISSAARDVLDAIVRLIDACESLRSSNNPRVHGKVRTQLEDAYAEAWKRGAGSRSRLHSDEAKRVFMREIRDPKSRLIRAREILARRVERRHAPGIVEGGVGSATDGRGAADVFNYVADDVVRAVKSQQSSEGGGDFPGAYVALGTVVACAAHGALRLDPSAKSYADALARCADAFQAEADRSDCTDRVACASASLALARAFAEKSSA
ncbi:unnamed product [Ostreococcus tauri]|uniref:Unnamed product n=1 Tax=Ostreococcus tauri TaxID=70448 RepID=A0A096PA01_OSTTA|nr:unnamed product [Ostreococcus tauri]CEG00885.1 unnamed product [Ostreococcus tauri]|eukprot:XP_022840648.1 unnamed product [Ostreococcus tauri]